MVKQNRRMDTKETQEKEAHFPYHTKKKRAREKKGEQVKGKWRREWIERM